MRFERLTIEAFGGIEELDTGSDTLPDLVVVRGPNEAGKSTFFHFLSALLYGFYPATRDGNPFSPWSGRDATGSGEVRLDDGTAVRIRRRLLSTPTGSLERGGRTEELRNRTVPFARHVPREVFREVFAITLAELAALRGESWSRVQDRLVTGMGASDIRPPREVADELEEAAGRVWRPNRRGNQALREIAERIRALREKRRDAAERDREIRSADRELGTVREELREARRERERCRLYIERYSALLPLREQLERIELLREDAGPAEELEGLPAEPGARLDELAAVEAETSDRLAELEEEIGGVRERVAAFDDDARRIVAARERIRELVGRVGALEPVRARAARMQQEARDLDRRARALAAELLSEPLEACDPGMLESAAPARVRSAVDGLREAREELRVAEGEVPPPADGEPPPHLRLSGAGLLVVGVLMVGGGIVGGSPATTGAGAVVLAVGAGLLGAGIGTARRHRRDAAARREAATARVREARTRLETARSRLEDALEGLPVRPELTERPTADLATRLERLGELLRDRDDRRRSTTELEEEAAAADEVVTGLEATLGRELPSPPAAAAHVLEEALRDAERAETVAEAARREAKRLRRERERLSSRLAETRTERRELEERLEAMGGGDAERGAERARARIKAAERAAQLRDELERSHEDLDEIRERIRAAEEAGEDWIVDEDVLVRRRAREEELVDAIEELAGRAEALDTRIEHLREGATVDEVEGELRAERERREEAERERDRMWVLARLLRQADRRFREEHQPDVLRRAGELLGRITDGRYERLLLGEDSADATFLLRRPGYPGPVEVGQPVSTGTREQVYLSLRLAILDHLDRGGETMPLFMDEAVVNWDRDRRRRAFDLLSGLASDRQLFFFTCHEAMARELGDRGAGIVELAGPR